MLALFLGYYNREEDFSGRADHSVLSHFVLQFWLFRTPLFQVPKRNHLSQHFDFYRPLTCFVELVIWGIGPDPTSVDNRKGPTTVNSKVHLFYMFELYSLSVMNQSEFRSVVNLLEKSKLRKRFTLRLLNFSPRRMVSCNF
ncbi:hypothetical protein XENOCAPTIV_010688 [Xenoophorus captivus]|uniref:Maturase K n=1 Tax=Xenoophorus captivus TaxID=1517983 RepID=A0ABV0QLP6_9TELE